MIFMSKAREDKLFVSMLDWIYEHMSADDEFERALQHIGFTEKEISAIMEEAD